MHFDLEELFYSKWVDLGDPPGLTWVVLGGPGCTWFGPGVNLGGPGWTWFGPGLSAPCTVIICLF